MVIITRKHYNELLARLEDIESRQLKIELHQKDVLDAAKALQSTKTNAQINNEWLNGAKK